MRRAALRCAAHAVRPLLSGARRILVVSKTTRYEQELIKLASSHSCSRNDAEKLLNTSARQVGSNVDLLRRTHSKHESFVRAFVAGLRGLPLRADVRVVKCYGELERGHLTDADLVFSAGGDGTFLRTASFIQDLERAPLLCGINTDPFRSEGFLCAGYGRWARDARALGTQEVNDAEVRRQVERLLARLCAEDFVCVMRQRVRVTVEPVARRGRSGSIDSVAGESDATLGAGQSDVGDAVCDGRSSTDFGCAEGGGGGAGGSVQLLALNDVLVAEYEAQNVSYYELCFRPASEAASDTPHVEKQKSSGLLIATGTGSTAWNRTTATVQPDTVKRILELAGMQEPVDPNLCQRVAEEFSNSLVFDPSSQLMRFQVREPIVNGVFTCEHPHDFARSIVIRPRSSDMRIFVDGQLRAPLPPNHVARFAIRPEDALKVIHFTD